jgi:hypothetical protein
MREYSAAVLRTAICSDKVFLSVEVIMLANSVANDIIDVHLVAEEATDATESLHELVAFRTLVSNEVDFETEVSVMEQEPVGKAHGVENFEFDSTLGILKVLGVLLLHLTKESDSGLSSGGVFKLVSGVGDVFPQDHGIKSTHSHGLDSVIHSKLNHSGVHGDVVIKFAEHFLLLYKLNICHAVSGKSDSLVEAIIRSVSNIEYS